VVEEAVDAFSHFLGGFVGEGDGKDGVRGDAFFANEPGDAAGDDAGLSGAGTGEDSKGPSVASTAARCSGFRLSMSGCTADESRREGFLFQCNVSDGTGFRRELAHDAMSGGAIF